MLSENCLPSFLQKFFGLEWPFNERERGGGGGLQMSVNSLKIVVSASESKLTVNLISFKSKVIFLFFQGNTFPKEA